MDVRNPFVGESFSELEWYYADNGFRSLRGMCKEHEPILQLACEVLSQSNGNVLDLGCGNGVLLTKICLSNHNLAPWGVDLSRDAIIHAQLMNPQYADHFVVSNLFNDCAVWSDGRQFELVLLMPARLIDVPGQRAQRLLKRIKGRAKKLMVYAYDAVLYDHSSLQKLAQKTHIKLAGHRDAENVAMVNMEEL